MIVSFRVKRLFLSNPFRLLPVSFAAMIGIGTILLSIPQATATGRKTSFLDALFTATSAVCVTGLSVVDTATHWTGFGKGVILFLIQIGGLGIVTVVSIGILLVADRIGPTQTALKQGNKQNMGMVLGFIAVYVCADDVVQAPKLSPCPRCAGGASGSACKPGAGPDEGSAGLAEAHGRASAGGGLCVSL
jgi:Trk-type K+ transport system membrane component